MKKHLSLILTALLALGLTACGTPEVPEVMPPELDTSAPPEEDGWISCLEWNDDPYAAYRGVLLEGKSFFSVTGMELLDLAHLRESITPTDLTLLIQGLTVIDMDGDGTDEVLLDLAFIEGQTFGCEVLHYQDGIVYGYYEVHRGLGHPKTDGTFSYSSGSSNSGDARITGFSTLSHTHDGEYYPGYDFESITSIREGKYYIGEKESSYREYHDAQLQYGKEPATWYELTEENIELILK